MMPCPAPPGPVRRVTLKCRLWFKAKGRDAAFRGRPAGRRKRVPGQFACQAQGLFSLEFQKTVSFWANKKKWCFECPAIAEGSAPCKTGPASKAVPIPAPRERGTRPARSGGQPTPVGNALAPRVQPNAFPAPLGRRWEIFFSSNSRPRGSCGNPFQASVSQGFVPAHRLPQHFRTFHTKKPALKTCTHFHSTVHNIVEVFSARTPPR